MSNWMDIVSAIEGGPLLVCIVVLYMVVLGVLNDSKERRALFMDLLKTKVRKLTIDINRLSDRIK